MIRAQYLQQIGETFAVQPIVALLGCGVCRGGCRKNFKRLFLKSSVYPPYPLCQGEAIHYRQATNLVSHHANVLDAPFLRWLRYNASPYSDYALRMVPCQHK